MHSISAEMLTEIVEFNKYKSLMLSLERLKCVT